MIWWIFISRAL